MLIFIESTPVDIIELKKAVQDKNLPKMKEISHKLKSLFKSYNLANITSNIIQIESISRTTTFDEKANILIEEIVSEYEILKVEMQTLLNEL